MAEASLFCVHPSGRNGTVTIQIGRPYQLSAGGAACPVALVGLDTPLPDVRGMHTFQALCLALRLARALLQDFEARGGRLYVSEDQPVRVNAAWLFCDLDGGDAAGAA